ncbi:MAG: AraC family transcriptional regulator [Bacteroidetes bacterium]|nr:MAG: AraC family transcriptional regulator [Bacteroidota bacterium]
MMVSDTTVQQAAKYILENLDRRGLSVHEVARAVYISERQFYRHLKKTTGMTPYLFIQKIRLQEAKHLADEKAVDSIEELARSVGYTRADHFVHLFSRKFGRHPQDILDS